MKTSVFGLGYVGCVTAACLAREGHDVIGVDIDAHKVGSIGAGKAPFFESQLTEFIADAVSQRRLRATQDEEEALHNCDVALVCVGTPTQANGTIRLDQVRNVLAGIGRALRKRNGYCVVALRSTVLPTAVTEELIPLLEDHAGKELGAQLGFVSNPEFLREGSAIRDFYQPPWNIIGEYDGRSGDLAAGLYARISAPLIRTDVQTALLVKYFSNVFHALKVVFANEVGSVCREIGVDSSRLMEIFCADTNLNVSPKYLRPGFPFGGSCLPKDLRALLADSHRRQLHLPVLEAILPSNELRLKECIRMVTESRHRKIGLVGLTFKAGTDDLRESPAVELAETLLGKGYELRIFDPQINPGMLHGSNLRFIETSIPHIWKLLAYSLENLIEDSEVVVVTQKLPPVYDKDFGLFRPDQVCIDFVGAVDRKALPAGTYRSFNSVDNEATELLVADAASTSVGGD